MKVLMLSWEYPPHNVGGLGKHVTELVPALAAEGVEVQLLTPQWVRGMGEDVLAETSQPSSDGIAPTTIHRVTPPDADVNLSDFFTGAWRTNLNLEERGRELLTATSVGQFDLIHCHDWLVAFAGVALKHAYKVPLLATIHATESGRSRGHISGEMPRAIHNVEWWLSYEAWRIICCSLFMEGEVTMAFHVPSDKIDVIPNGVDTNRFDALDGVDLTDFRRRFAEPHEKIIFNVGRVVYEKGVHVLVDAMPRILAEYPNSKLVIAGSGNFLSAVQSQVDERGLGQNVIVTGFLPDDDRDRLFKVADVAVFPSLYEPFGIVALEAMAARTPVVVADVGGLREVIRLHETGITVWPDNAESLAWGILHTLRHPEWSRARADMAYQVVREEFNWRAIARRTKRMYERIVAERAQATW